MEEVKKHCIVSFHLNDDERLLVQRAFQVPVNSRPVAYKKLLLELCKNQLRRSKEVEEVVGNGGASASEVEGAGEGAVGGGQV